MDFSKLESKEKRRLFEFISHLAVLAGREMSKETFENFNDVILMFLDDNNLMEDFMAVASKVKIVTKTEGNC